MFSFIKQEKNQLVVSVCDPTQKLESGQITIKEEIKGMEFIKSKNINFPGSMEKGQEVQLIFSKKVIRYNLYLSSKYD
ncbi:hypothetical protein MKW35_14205 [Aestuariibaculum sp. L182]|uniref:Uncharacterized protein n=1 Tax=Aestuariibaculum lutulentum TaxID=2920935 RepID=A0ABS9RLE4_9FLAO|nr:hypothetical protein [Aestuariibaculum lutulentum]